MAAKAVADEEILEKVGNTPLVTLDSLSNDGKKYFAKLEGHNPFGSVKDRAALWMIKDGEEKGILKRGHSIIIEPTSGNTGIALTGIANHLGYKVEIVIPEKASNETKEIIRNLGAKVYETSDDLLHHQDLTPIILLINMQMKPTLWVITKELDLKFGNKPMEKSLISLLA